MIRDCRREMYNPFIDNPEEIADEVLASNAQHGDHDALESLVVRHQPWIYNIARRMLWLPNAAEDATQEVLIKMIQGLPGFRGASRFRTWLYRITVNHMLNVNRESGRAVEAAARLAHSGSASDAPRDLDPPDPRTVPEPLEILVEEAKQGCMAAMLLCFDGLQRAVYTLGEIFGVTDSIGAEVLEMTPANFRQILSRTRKDLYSFMHGRCGLANPANPCSCPRKTRDLIERGQVDPSNLQFTAAYRQKVRDVAPDRLRELMDTSDRLSAELFRAAPFLDVPARLEMVRKALASVPLTSPE